MAAQQFFLRWDSYSHHISNAFGTLRNQEDLVDVTLSCEGKKIRAHKVLLSACSPYFRDVFKDNPCQHPVIVFKNVKYDDLLAIVEFMYQGEVSVVQDALPSFLNTAELLSVQGLTEGGNSTQSTTTGTIIDTSPQQQIIATATMPKTVTIKPQQTVTLCQTPERRTFAKKVYANPTRATTIKTVTPITVFSPKATQGHTKRLVTTTQPIKLTTTSGGMMVASSPATTTLVTSLGDPLDSNTIQLQQTTLSGSNNTDGPPMMKRKRILFDNEENISIEDESYVKQMEMDIPDYIEIQTSMGGGSGDDEKAMVTVSTEDLMGGTDSDSQAQENVIIEEAGFDASQGEDDDDDKDKEVEITYTKDEQGNGTVVLTPVRDSSKDGDKQQTGTYGQDSPFQFRCSVCWKGFKHPMSLTLHRDLHSGKTKCPVCERAFSRVHDMRTHVQKKHFKMTMNIDATTTSIVATTTTTTTSKTREESPSEMLTSKSSSGDAPQPPPPSAAAAPKPIASAEADQSSMASTSSAKIAPTSLPEDEMPSTSFQMPILPPGITVKVSHSAGDDDSSSESGNEDEVIIVRAMKQ